MIYVPPIVIEEAVDLQKEHGLQSRSEALKEVVKYARTGRELERLMKLDFRFKPTSEADVEEKKRKIRTLFSGGLFG